MMYCCIFRRDEERGLQPASPPLSDAGTDRASASYRRQEGLRHPTLGDYAENQFVNAPSVPMAYVVGPVASTTPFSLGDRAPNSTGVITGT